jgi:adenylate cyclase
MAEVRAALERILASADFDASPRSREFLRHIVEETLAGREDGLTQTALAVRVFGRRRDFDPTVDPIVRIQAGRLRRSIERHYLLGGARDPVRLELPRGGYVPRWRWADAGEENGAPAPRVDDTGGWPALVLRVRTRASDEIDSESARFIEHLAVELDRYRDVRVRLGPEGGGPRAPGASGRFTLWAQLDEAPGRRLLTVRLEESSSGSQIWAEEFREDPAGAASFVRESAKVAAARVASEHGAIVHFLAREHPAPELADTTYGALLRSYRFFLVRESESFVSVLEALRAAVAREPECALAWVQLSRLHVVNHAFEVAPADTSIEQGLALAQHAVLLDPTSQRARAMLAFALLVKGELEAGRAEVESALAVNPDTYVYQETLGWLWALLGDWERGVALVRDALARNPHHMPVGYHALWADHLRRGEAGAAYQAALRYPDTGFFWRRLMCASSLGHLGRFEDARSEVAGLLAEKPDFRDRGRVLVGRLLKQPDLQAAVADGLAKAGLALDGAATPPGPRGPGARAS